MEMKFDPMTGEPITPASEQPEVKFDPMTGQPITQQGTVTGYDPMTGQPIYAGTNAVYTAATATKAGLGIGAKIGIAVAAVAVVGAVAFAGVKNGAFLGKSGKVALAASNTFKEQPQIVENMNFANIITSNSYTLGAEVSYEGQSVMAEYRCNSKKKQLAATLDVAGASDLSAYITLNDEALELAVPELMDDVLVYYYTKDNDGLLVDALGEDSIEQMNELLATAASGKTTNEEAEKCAKEILDEFKSLKFEKVSAEKFEVDGKDRKCKGYSTEITSDNINNIIDAYMDYMEESIPEDILQEADWRDVQSQMSDLERQIDRMDDIELEFFIYKNQLACIRADVEGEELEILFHGGDYRMQNMEIVIDGKTYVEMVGETSGKTETIKIKAMGQTIVKVEYDAKSGDYEVKVEDIGTIKGNIEKSRNGITVTVSKFFGYDGIKMKVYALKSATFEEYSTKNLFDIGNADESDYEDLLEDIDMSVLQDFEDIANDIF